MYTDNMCMYNVLSAVQDGGVKFPSSKDSREHLFSNSIFFNICVRSDDQNECTNETYDEEEEGEGPSVKAEIIRGTMILSTTFFFPRSVEKEKLNAETYRIQRSFLSSSIQSNSLRNSMRLTTPEISF